MEFAGKRGTQVYSRYSNIFKNDLTLRWLRDTMVVRVTVWATGRSTLAAQACRHIKPELGRPPTIVKEKRMSETSGTRIRRVILEVLTENPHLAFWPFSYKSLRASESNLEFQTRISK